MLVALAAAALVGYWLLHLEASAWLVGSWRGVLAAGCYLSALALPMLAGRDWHADADDPLEVANNVVLGLTFVSGPLSCCTIAG
jgi:hypothetical protein